MSGFAARNGPPTAVGTHDPIYVSALAVSDGVSTVLLFCYDLIGLPSEWVSSTRPTVERECGVAARSQMYCCSHTHCGPGTGVIPYVLGDAPAVDKEFMALLARHTTSAAREALNSMSAVRLDLGSAESYAGWNRRSAEASPSGPDDGGVDDIDPAVVVAQFLLDDGGVLATLVNYGCHATSSRDSYYSSDYIGYMRTLVEEETSGPCMYVNGAGGDVNPRGAAHDFRSFELAAATGQRLGRDVVDALGSLEPSESHQVGSASAPAQLVYGDLISLEQARQIRADGEKAAARAQSPADEFASMWTQVFYAERVQEALEDPEGAAHIEVEVQALRIGDLGIAAFPSEFFSDDGRAVRRERGPPNLMVACWSNGLWGYTPTRRAMPLGGYEVEVAFKIYGQPAVWDPVSGDNLRAAARLVIGDLFP